MNQLPRPSRPTTSPGAACSQSPAGDARGEHGVEDQRTRRRQRIAALCARRLGPTGKPARGDLQVAGLAAEALRPEGVRHAAPGNVLQARLEQRGVGVEGGDAQAEAVALQGAALQLAVVRRDLEQLDAGIDRPAGPDAGRRGSAR
jgi:hypothetical protein